MKRLLSTLLLSVIVSPVSGNMILPKGSERLKVFYTLNDLKGWNAVLMGQVLSYSARDQIDNNDLMGKISDKSKVTVRLYAMEGVREGDILYIINNKNLIVAKMKVRTIYKSASFGPMAIGYGNFRLGSIGDRVVQRVIDNYSKYAYINKSRGDYYLNIGDIGTAISEYQKAIELDRGNPEAHLALGLIYKKQGNYQFAFKEFHEGYKNLSRLYDNEDKYILLKSMAEVRFVEVYESNIPRSLKNKYRKEGIRYCREALRIYPKSAKMNFYLGIFHYESSMPDDKTARDYFLRVIEINPTHARAYEYLAELYFKHENIAKARMYAMKALSSNPGSSRARIIIRKIDRYNRGVILK